MTGSVGQDVRRRAGGARVWMLTLASVFATSSLHIATAEVAEAADVTAAYVPLTPYRLADTRLDRVRMHAARRVDDRRSTSPAGRACPSDIVAVAVTVTATESAGPGFVTLYPGGTDRPLGVDAQHPTGPGGRQLGDRRAR